MSMENLNNQVGVDHQPINGLKSLRNPPYHPKSIPWLEMRVFYVRVSNFIINDSTPEYLTLNHIPLGPETIVEVNGGKNSAYLDYVSVQLRRDRIDKSSEEATYVCTESIRMSGSVRYEVYDQNDILLSGVLQLANDNDSSGETKRRNKKWNIRCQSHAAAIRYFLKGEQYVVPRVLVPTVEVYVAGCFSGIPTILTKTIQIGSANKHNKKSVLEPIPESNSSQDEEDAMLRVSQVSRYRDYRTDDGDPDDEYHSLYPTTSYKEDYDGELSWFTSGVRVGVGIGLGVCVGVGLGVGLLVKSYHTTSGIFKRRLL